MKIPARHRAGITILEPKGKITIGVGDVALREAVHEALEAGSTKILVNLKDVSTIDLVGNRRAGLGLHLGDQPRRSTATSAPAAQGSGHSADHPAGDSVRGAGRRGRGSR